MTCLLICFADGADSMIDAGRRLKEQTSICKIFTKVVVTNKNELIQSTRVSQEILDFMNSRNRGFGYWIWKPIVLQLALEDYWGKFDYIVYLDAGCEYVDNYFSRLRMQQFLNETKKQGVKAFATPYSEFKFSKKRVLNLLKVEENRFSPQIEATTIFIKNSRFSSNFIAKWLQECLADQFRNIDDTLEEESEKFQEHRHDQSVFSVTYKNYNLGALKSYHPVMKSEKEITLAHSIAFASWPIWQIRNRSGESVSTSKCNSNFYGALSYTIFPFRHHIRNFSRKFKGIFYFTKYHLAKLNPFDI